ncbi:MAG: RNA polymerase sigma factor [Sedimentisphaeraceae bacterium JB056]
MSESDSGDFKKRSSFAAGDNSQWQQELEEAIPKLLGMFRKAGFNIDESQDFCQQTVMKAVQKRNNYDPAKAAPVQWICGIGRNVMLEAFRANATRRQAMEKLAKCVDQMDTQPIPPDILERSETALAVRETLEQLGEPYRRVLEAMYLEDLPAKVIATELGKSQKAVHSLLYRARKLFAEKLKKVCPLLAEEKS